MPLADDTPDFEVEIAPPSDAPKQSLKDRLFGAMPAAKPEAKAGKAKAKATKARAEQIDANLIKQLIPLTIASLVATQSRNLISDPYKMCAPEQKEVIAMISPYFNILSRHLEVTGQLPEYVIDLIMAALASLMYGTRAFSTYIQIKEYEATHHDGSIHSNGDVGGGPGRSNTAVGGERTATNERDSQALDRAVGFSSQPISDDRNGGTDAIIVDSNTATGEAALMGDLFRRDLAGRRQMGLLPRDLAS